jgi:hypothetical protein
MSGGCWHRGHALQSGYLQGWVLVDWSPAHISGSFVDIEKLGDRTIDSFCIGLLRCMGDTL